MGKYKVGREKYNNLLKYLFKSITLHLIVAG